ncbi:hypothetical protein [Effusibacillus lacus]|uniref:Yip1 domain-containing protein n=1 Tax=Effusibacillus lacus TaxID=1348429 RepID=A0A292YI56_9BACL|nr:hypothetical protein [Effusibacillus lacus]TCS74718.1 hypothetical protein EDD64_1114 [Effusibacillus lacus]GAX88531.1 hypothetical protein EFBL_0140 [Effusibacillus lacus]
MLQTILDLFTYPGRTIDRLLAEKNYVKSNKIFFLTMVVVSLSAVVTLYLMQRGTAVTHPWLLAVAAIAPIGGLLFTRFLFRQLVPLGLLMVNNRNFPRDPVERTARSRELYLLYPYHVMPLVVPALLLPFAAAPTGQDSFHLLAKLVLMIGYVLLSWSAFAFQIVVMVLIIKRIYGVSTGQAFWGPLLAYLLFGVLLSIVAITIGLLIAFVFRFSL